jgi:hypothetical protein
MSQSFAEMARARARAARARRIARMALEANRGTNA